MAEKDGETSKAITEEAQLKRGLETCAELINKGEGEPQKAALMIMEYPELYKKITAG